MTTRDDMVRWRRWMRPFETSDHVPVRPQRTAAVVGAGLPPVDLTAVARSFGAEAVHVRAPEQLEAALPDALATPRPTVVHAEVDPDELVIPPRLEMAQTLGFAKAKVQEFFGIGERDGGVEALAELRP